MKNRFFLTVLTVLFVASVVFFVDYVLLNLIGIVANAFNASDFFFVNVYPYISALVISGSIAYPLMAMLMKGNKKNHTKIFFMFHHKNSQNYKQTA